MLKILKDTGNGGDCKFNHWRNLFYKSVLSNASSLYPLAIKKPMIHFIAVNANFVDTSSPV